MSPILGIWASAQQRAFDVGDYESIATVTVGAGGVSSIDLSSIPSTYTHLQVRMMTRCTTAGSGLSNCVVRFNADGGLNYTYHVLFGNGGGSAGAGSTTGAAQAYFGTDTPQASATANAFGANIIDILDYANTNKYKTIRTLSGSDLNGSGDISLWSNLWLSTAAINQLTFYTDANFAQHTQIALYGIKG